jgi:hypothetical protein
MNVSFGGIVGGSGMTEAAPPAGIEALVLPLAGVEPTEALEIRLRLAGLVELGCAGVLEGVLPKNEVSGERNVTPGVCACSCEILSAAAPSVNVAGDTGVPALDVPLVVGEFCFEMPWVELASSCCNACWLAPVF